MAMAMAMASTQLLGSVVPSITAVHGESFESELSPKSCWDSIKCFLDAFYRFSRPHVIVGTVINIISLGLLAVERLSDISPIFFIGMIQVVAAVLSMNIYVSGLNQLTDIEIDKINKSYLPLASGEYSFRTGVIIIASCLILSFGLGCIVGSPPLFWLLSIYFVLGTAYSIDFLFFRWKRYAALAAMCLVVVQGIVFHLALFLHMQTNVFKRPTMFPKSLIFATTFMSFFYLVLALFKDTPDMEGDAKHGIRSLSVHLGQKRVFWISVLLLEIAYGVAILVGATFYCLWSKMIMVLGHALLASILWYRAKSVDLSNNATITSFYMFMWKLFYAEYFIIPLLR